MKLTPARGFLFVEAQDVIASANKEVGFGGKTEKFKLESPYKFKVVAVGGPIIMDGYQIESEAKVGDIVSSISTNTTYREKIEDIGFLLDNRHILVLGFSDILGIWQEQWRDLSQS